MDNKELLVGIEFLEHIVKGYNPITAERIPESDLLRACDIVGRLEDLVRELKKDYDIVTGKVAPSVSTRPNIEVAPNLTISEIAKNIDKVFRLGTNKIRDKITDFLLQENFLILRDCKGKTTKYATEKGKALGIVNENRISSKGQSYNAVVYSVEAQEYILSKLQEILNSDSKK